MRNNSKANYGLDYISHTINRMGVTFRRQLESDVGIDGIIELSDVDGNPNGHYLACQVKSGLGNVTVSKDYFTYYISNVHYSYWTHLSLPVLLFLYDDRDDSIYWQHVHDKFISKTKTRYKIKIPKSNKIDLQEWALISRSFEKKGDLLSYDNNLFSIIEVMSYFNLVIESLSQIVSHNEDWNKAVNETANRFTETLEKGERNKLQFAAILKTLEVKSTILSKGINTENRVFSHLFAESIIANIKVVSLLVKEKSFDVKSFKENFLSSEPLNNHFASAIKELLKLQTIVESAKNNNVELFNAVKLYSVSLTHLIFNLNTASDLYSEYRQSTLLLLK